MLVLRNLSWAPSHLRTGKVIVIMMDLVSNYAFTTRLLGHGTDGLGNSNLGHENLKPKPMHAAQALIELTKQHPDTYVITIGMPQYIRVFY